MTVAAPLLSLQGIRKEFAGRGSFLRDWLKSATPILAVDDVSWDIGPGETLALVGESGSGKTTTGRLVTLLDRPSAGRILFEAKDVTRLRGSAVKAYRRRVQMIFQNPFEALDPRLTIGQSVAEPLRLHRIGTAAQRRDRAAFMLAEAELRPAAAFLDRYPSDLSGGQLQRVAIARGLVLEPALVVADEPVSMLDVSVRAGVLAVMRRLQRNHHVSTLFITHDLAVARLMATRIAVMYRGAIVEEGATEDVIGRPAHPYTRLLLAAVADHRPGRAQHRPRVLEANGATGIGCRFAPRCPLAFDLCRRETPPAATVGPRHVAACHRAGEVAQSWEALILDPAFATSQSPS